LNIKEKCGCEDAIKVNQDEESSCSCEGGVMVKSAGEIECGCTVNKSSEVEKKKESLRIASAPDIYRERRPVKGEVVTVIEVTFESSIIELSKSWSRAVPRGDIHEIMIWNPDEKDANDAAAIAFIEITHGGNIVNGDSVLLDGVTYGRLVGFDYNHMPNHMNIIVETKSLSLPLKLGSIFEFSPNPGNQPDLECC
jgi:hypothetical protein